MASKKPLNKKSATRRRAAAKSATRGGTASSRKKKSTRQATTRRNSTQRKPKRNVRRNFRPRFRVTLDLRQKALILGIGLIFFTAVLVLSLLSPNQGQLTSALSDMMWQLFGWGGLIVPIVMAACGFYLVLWGMDQPPHLPSRRLLGLGLLFLSLEAFASLALVLASDNLPDVWSVAQAQTGGGYLGGLIVWLLTGVVGRLGAVFVLLLLGFMAIVLAAGVSRQELGALLRRLAVREPAPEPQREIAINPGRPARPDPLAEVQPPLPLTTSPAAPLSPSRVPPSPRPSVSSSSPTRQPARPTRPAAAPAPSLEQAPAPMPVFLGRGAAQSWTLPRVEEMLEAGTDQEISDVYIREQVEVIEHTLESFGAPATVVEINQGPTITQYGVEPSFVEQRGGKRTKVKVGKIASLADDLALALVAKSIRIQAPVPGKGYVGIEVPNTSKALVSLRDVMESGDFQRIRSPLRLGLGQNVAGQPIATDLAQMPHLLIAGTTGSGKSVCVNAIAACLLLQNTPDDLKLVMVDPKRVELTNYNGIPHLVAPVVVDLERVVGTLQWAMREMDNRYKRLATAGVRNIAEFNQKAVPKGEEKMAHIVIFIDELADLMMLSPEETERGITRLAQMARATGIHMVIATQRPSVDVVTGLIKANFPARIAFAVASSTDSRVILDTTGAERLLGQGDMLFQSPDAAAPIRMQGCFVSEKELHNIIDYWQGARRSINRPATAGSVGSGVSGGATSVASSGPAGGEVSLEKKVAASRPAVNTVAASPPAATQPAANAPPATTPAPTQVSAPATALPVPTLPPPPVQQPLWDELRQMEADGEKVADELLPEAIELVRKLNKASTSLLQRRFRIGYTRAARLVDMMEEQGIIGPPTGNSKAREVLAPLAGAEGQEPETPQEEAEEEN